MPHAPYTHTGSEEAGWELTLGFVQEMMDAFKQQRPIHKRFALHIVLQVHRGSGHLKPLCGDHQLQRRCVTSG